MTWWHDHPDASTLAKRHWKEAQLLLIAKRQPCIKIRDDELSNIDRVMRAAIPEDLQKWKLPKSWFVAVLICKGDDTEDLAQTVQRLGLDAQRFHFYLHADASVAALKAWADAGLPLDRVDDGVKDWATLHKLLGIDFNVQIVDDFIDAA